ncbi:MAG: serine--tRNA ligase [candidate division Zixibacteria bacterium]|nr:serine--tRNA ligase [candidate division Zixibacteria bacterium]
MLDLKQIRENPEAVKAGIATKNDKSDIDAILEMDANRRELIKQGEALKGERNRASAEIGKKKKAGEPADEAVAAMREVGQKIASLDKQLREIDDKLRKALAWIPNLPHKDAPVGVDESTNVVVRTWGEIPKRDFKVLPHWEVGEKLGILDLAAGARISGSGFFVLRGLGARLQRALISYMLDMHTADGFVEYTVPYVVTTDTMFGTGQLPKLEEDMYKTACEDDDLFLIPTGEVPLTNIFKQQILDYQQLPVYMVTHTPCFRREAGAAGKDTRGMMRVHQFDKVELVKIVRPETSYDEHDSLTAQAEKVLQELQLPYRVADLATGDLSFAAARCYDLELWAPGVERWLEISSISNFEDFQARRMNCRFRDENKKVLFPHTINGSGVALARLIPAILENYQNEDGTVTIPEVLCPYMGGADKIG